MSQKTILITGGCGFIGSQCVRQFYRTHPEYVIVNLDLLTYAGNLENLKLVEEQERALPSDQKRYIFVKGSITDEALLHTLCKQYDFRMIINFAAETHVDRSIISMNDFISTNIGGARSLMEAVRANKVDRFIHISTDEVYGSIAYGTASEQTPLHPSNPYSSSKAAADLIVQSFVTTHNVPAIIIRGSNNYGTYQYPEKLIPLAITNVIEKHKIPVHGAGVHIRSWLHVADFCDAIDLIAHHGAVGSIYNVSAEERSNMYVLQLICDSLGVNLEEYKEHVSDRPGADTRYAPDSTKLREELGWVPKRSLQKNMKEIVDWYMKNEAWWRAIKTKKEFQDHYLKQSKGQWY
ncbi:dTDP-glucose 4,6-dehydratase [Candidatus Peregrinibacteria bacterium]|nr:dTDP-glucose 4,6-dehydratase [Candidatus Peregrinibacteria bacterium]